MKYLIWAVAIVGVFLAAIMGFLGYMGMLSTLDVRETEMGPFTHVYEDFTGPYKNTGPVFQKVYDRLEADGIETSKGIGIYFDDPREVSEEKLRSQCGSVVEESDLERFEALKENYNVQRLERKRSIVVDFPIRNSMSYMIGPMKAYPRLMEYATEKGYEMHAPYELYDMENNVIHFVMPVE